MMESVPDHNESIMEQWSNVYYPKRDKSWLIIDQNSADFTFVKLVNHC